MWGINKHCDRIYWFFIRAFLLKLLKILAFIISKSYFINFNIPLYNIPNIKNFIFFITLLKYYYYYYYFFLILNLSLPLSSSMLRVCLLSNPLPQPPPPTCFFVFPCLFLSFLPKQHEIMFDKGFREKLTGNCWINWQPTNINSPRGLTESLSSDHFNLESSIAVLNFAPLVLQYIFCAERPKTSHYAIVDYY